MRRLKHIIRMNIRLTKTLEGVIARAAFDAEITECDLELVVGATVQIGTRNEIVALLH